MVGSYQGAHEHKRKRSTINLEMKLNFAGPVCFAPLNKNHVVSRAAAQAAESASFGSLDAVLAIQAKEINEQPLRVFGRWLSIHQADSKVECRWVLQLAQVE